SRKIPVTRISFPDRSTGIGSLIDGYLKNEIDFNPETIHLLFSANRWENLDKLRRGIIVLDRYVYSGIAHSVVLGCDEKWARMADIGLPYPDISVFIDLRPSDALMRAQFGEEKYENVEFMEKTYAVLKRLVEESRNPLVVDGSLSEDEITEIIFNNIIAKIE
ncbi:Thymidylate kinase, partial [Dictyocoela roeselum]